MLKLANYISINKLCQKHNALDNIYFIFYNEFVKVSTDIPQSYPKVCSEDPIDEVLMTVLQNTKSNITVGLEGPITITDRIYERLRDMILHAELAPGDKLLPAQLSQLFGVSSTPIREALRLLEQANLVEITPHKGAIVRPILSAKQVDDLYRVRLTLEQLAIRQAASMGSEYRWEGLQQAVENYTQAVEKDDFENALMLDMRFHSLIVQASGNEILRDIFERLGNQIQILRRMDRGAIRRQQSLKDHQIILEALKRHDYKEAATALEEHILRGREHVIQVLSQLDHS